MGVPLQGLTLLWEQHFDVQMQMQMQKNFF